MLDENELVAKLSELEEETAGTYRWSETAGLKQLLRVRDIDDEETVGLAAHGLWAPGERAQETWYKAENAVTLGDTVTGFRSFSAIGSNRH